MHSLAQRIFWTGLALSPFYNLLLFHPAGVELSVVDLVFLASFVVWIVNILERDRFRLNHPSILLLVFLGATFVSVYIADDQLVAVKLWGRTTMRVIVFAVMLPDLMSRTMRWRTYLFLFTIAGVLFGALNYLGYFLAPKAFLMEMFLNPMRPAAYLPLIHPVSIETAGGGNYGHEIGHWLAAVTPFIIAFFLTSSNKLKKTFWFSVGIISIITITLSLTKSAWVGLAIGLTYMVYRLYIVHSIFFRNGDIYFRPKYWRNMLWISALSVLGFMMLWLVVLPEGTRNLIILGFTFQDVTSVIRSEIWRGLFPIIADNLIFGVGWNNLVATGLSGDPHSWWLGILAETGLVGFSLYTSAYLLIFLHVDRHATRMIHKGRVIAIGANAALLSLGFQGLFQMSLMWSISVWCTIGFGLFFALKVSPQVVNATLRSGGWSESRQITSPLSHG